MLKVIRCGFNTEWPSHDLGRVDKVGEVAGWHVLSHFPHGVPLWVYVFAARSVVWVIGSDWLHHMSCCYWRHHTHYGRLNDTFCCVLLCTPQQRLPFSGPDKPYKLPFLWGSSPPPSNTWFLGSTRTTSWLVQPFLQGSWTWPTDRQTCRPRYNWNESYLSVLPSCIVASTHSHPAEGRRLSWPEWLIA